MAAVVPSRAGPATATTTGVLQWPPPVLLNPAPARSLLLPRLRGQVSLAPRPHRCASARTPFPAVLTEEFPMAHFVLLP